MPDKKEIEGKAVIEGNKEQGFDIFQYFRRNLLVLLASQDMSARDLSIKVGFTESRVGNFLSKSAHIPTVLELSLIAQYFHVEMDNLIHDQIQVGFY